ncbi:hormogonium polysaccharide biosynthesis glycosyltransferase HpsE [Coleofasciculus sp.]|uniref:hormogonium polysaccharide biosynthesis glycosyltransferase HpsE n=1 Tax=Coleofasciculus sp. TaxID=3100458 RepID=UPI003A233735
MSLTFTVAIPTYNGASRIREVLERLRRQTGTESIPWEVIVIDNNSTDNTAEIVQAYQENWSADNPLRYCVEARQGAGFARQLAVQEAQAPLIGFLDDDNIPALNWVAAAVAFAQAYPQAGAYGSQIHPDFEVPPPDSLRPILPFLAIAERGDQPFRYEPRHKLLPPSAGLVIRKQAYLDTVPNQLILTGRIQGNMLTGEDLEMLSYMQLNGWEIWYNPAMEIDHKIPHKRLERDYLIPFIRGIGLSRFVTRMLSVKPWQRPLAFIAYTVNDLRKLIIHSLKYQGKLESDLVAACQWQLVLSSLESPFYLYKNGYFNRPNQIITLKGK